MRSVDGATRCECAGSNEVVECARTADGGEMGTDRIRDAGPPPPPDRRVARDARHVHATVGSMRVLGVDPGLTLCGLGVVVGDRSRRVRMVAVDVVLTPSTEDLSRRLL